MTTPLMYVGLDGEMTGTELTAGHGLCQIGVARPVQTESQVPQVFCSDIFFDGPVQPQALEVNGFTRKRLFAGPLTASVDERLSTWLVAYGANKEKKVVIPIGWNVGSFDLPFVREFLPQTFGLLSRRTVDLNAVCFTLGASGLKWGGSVPTWKGWKRMAKQYAQETLAGEYDPDGVWHDAGYDAAASLLAWNFLCNAIGNR